MNHRFKGKTTKLLEENIRENLPDLGLGRALRRYKARFIKENTNKSDFIKIKNFRSAKDNVRRNRR